MSHQTTARIAASFRQRSMLICSYPVRDRMLGEQRAYGPTKLFRFAIMTQIPIAMDPELPWMICQYRGPAFSRTRTPLSTMMGRKEIMLVFANHSWDEQEKQDRERDNRCLTDIAILLFRKSETFIVACQKPYLFGKSQSSGPNKTELNYFNVCYHISVRSNPEHAIGARRPGAALLRSDRLSRSGLACISLLYDAEELM